MGLSYLSDGPNERVAAVIQSGVCQRLVDLLQHPSPLVQTPALRAVGNVVTGDEHQTQVIIQNGALPLLHKLLAPQKKHPKGVLLDTIKYHSGDEGANTGGYQQPIDSTCHTPS